MRSRSSGFASVAVIVGVTFRSTASPAVARDEVVRSARDRVGRLSFIVVPSIEGVTPIGPPATAVITVRPMEPDTQACQHVRPTDCCRGSRGCLSKFRRGPPA